MSVRLSCVEALGMGSLCWVLARPSGAFGATVLTMGRRATVLTTGWEEVCSMMLSNAQVPTRITELPTTTLGIPSVFSGMAPILDAVGAPCGIAYPYSTGHVVVASCVYCMDRAKCACPGCDALQGSALCAARQGRGQLHVATSCHCGRFCL